MIDWIRSWFCEHKWNCVQKGPIRETDIYSSHTKFVGHYESYICPKCLKSKMVKWE